MYKAPSVIFDYLLSKKSNFKFLPPMQKILVLCITLIYLYQFSDFSQPHEIWGEVSEIYLIHYVITSFYECSLIFTDFGLDIQFERDVTIAKSLAPSIANIEEKIQQDKRFASSFVYCVFFPPKGAFRCFR